MSTQKFRHTDCIFCFILTACCTIAVSKLVTSCAQVELKTCLSTIPSFFSKLFFASCTKESPVRPKQLSHCGAAGSKRGRFFYDKVGAHTSAGNSHFLPQLPREAGVSLGTESAFICPVLLLLLLLLLLLGTMVMSPGADTVGTAKHTLIHGKTADQRQVQCRPEMPELLQKTREL